MKREKGLDYIRLISTLCIITYHFGHYTKSHVQAFLGYANGSLGVTFVAVFFMLSGACMQCAYGSRKLRLRTFYFKRWKSTLLPFYFVYLLFFLLKAVRHGALLYQSGVSPLSFALTALGMDGYLLYRIPSYYLIGEWFLGAIVLIYALYPLLKTLFEKAEWAVMAAAAAAFIWVMHTDIFTIDRTRNLLTCLFSFLSGMCVMKHAAFLKRGPIFLLAAAGSLALLFVPLPQVTAYKDWIASVFIFVALLNLGSRIGDALGVYPWIARLSGLTYGMYLAHHVLMVELTKIWNPAEPALAVLMLLGVVLLTAVFSAMLGIAVERTQRTKAFKALERACCEHGGRKSISQG